MARVKGQYVGDYSYEKACLGSAEWMTVIRGILRTNGAGGGSSMVQFLQRIDWPRHVRIELMVSHIGLFFEMSSVYVVVFDSYCFIIAIDQPVNHTDKNGNSFIRKR